jgi:hypothetical protein
MQNDAAAKIPPEDADFLEPSYLPRGVADLAGRIGYISSIKGGIDAVDLETGKLVWHSEEALVPLIVYKGLVLAQEQNGAKGARQNNLTNFPCCALIGGCTMHLRFNGLKQGFSICCR